MVSGHPKFIGIPRVDGLSTGPPNLGCHTLSTCLIKITIFSYITIIFYNDNNNNNNIN